MTITIYTKPGCFGCTKTEEKFREAGMTPGVDFQVIDLTQTPEAIEYVTNDLGYSQAPIVVVDEHDHWAGLNPVRIKAVTDAFKTDN
ncbi:glutaredoxin family protein [Sinomonas sp. ASV322]|uniref:glutaredoxin family protein n=1 Tax=Sinomonas sp. ASV322 TaxID=3041920 RepID=UPI0027DC9041|nr:glutaredoxin family protein [Sinomonas sp. ASV322]MDQ4504422.1 glutaredoxin family protein [Sinomonas sp. ASV322]